MEPGPRVVRRVLAGLAALLALACVLLLGAKWLVPGALPASWTAADDATDRDMAITSTARDFADAFVDLDYRTLDAGTAKVLSYATAGFKDEYTKDLASLKTLTTNNHSVTVGTVRDVGIGQVNDRTATVAVAVDTVVTNDKTKALKAQGSGDGTQHLGLMFQLTMNHVHGHWLVAGLQVVR